MEPQPEEGSSEVAYTVKEIFKSLQGEGAHVGTVAVFLRFAGCNLWSGREQDRATAKCRFCDTDFVGGAKYETADDLSDAVADAWGARHLDHRLVILTGGEPSLQYDAELRAALKKRRFTIAMETNGTGLGPEVDWTCVSPKAGTEIKRMRADEVKFVFPQEGFTPADAASVIKADHYFVQPKHGPDSDAHTAAAVAYCLAHPQWRLSLQTHKFIGID